MSLLPKRSPVEIEFSNISFGVPQGKKKEKKLILKNVSGLFRSAKLTAIMGPSGAGKTTLMHITAGYKLSKVEGTILINGLRRNARRFRKTACYIMQDDHHLPHLTIKEAMNVSANLKIGNYMSTSRKQEVICEILKTLGLNDSSETLTSALSGGQKKRLSIAVELVNNPPVMFFDEPTSGLDSQNSFQCINLLNSLAREGRTIICVIHQPSARLFEKFDYLYALSDGHCVYRGAVNGLLPFLRSLDFECPSYHNPADFVVEIASIEENIQKLQNAVTSGTCNSIDKVDGIQEETVKLEVTPLLKRDKFDNNQAVIQEMTFLPKKTTSENNINILMKNDDHRDENIFSSSFLTQISILLKRNYISIMRDAMLTKLRLTSHIIVGILIGMLYYDIGNDAYMVFNNSKFLFCCVLFIVFAGMMPTLLTFPLEMKVFVREHHNCWYSLKAYYMAKTMADIPFQIIYPIFYVLIVYFMSSQPYEVNRFCMFTGICVMISLVAQSLALLIGAAMEIQEATFFAPVISIPILLFSGFFVTLSAMPVYLQWLTYLSYMRYGFEGALLSIYGYNRPKMPCSLPYCHFRSPQKFLTELNFSDGSFWVDCLALAAFFVVLRISGYFVLLWKLRRER